MKKNIEVYEGLIKIGGMQGLGEPAYYTIDGEPIDNITDMFMSKRVRITIEELEEKE